MQGIRHTSELASPPILVVSGNGHDEDEAHEAGVLILLTKPVHRAALEAALAELAPWLPTA